MYCSLVQISLSPPTVHHFSGLKITVCVGIVLLSEVTANSVGFSRAAKSIPWYSSFKDILGEFRHLGKQPIVLLKLCIQVNIQDFRSLKEWDFLPVHGQED